MEAKSVDQVPKYSDTELLSTYLNTLRPFEWSMVAYLIHY